MRKLAFALSLIIVFMIPWEDIVNLPGFGEGTSTAARYLGLVIAAFWIGTVVITGKFRRPKPFHIKVLVFVLWNTASIFWSASPSRTLSHIMTWAQLFGLTYIFWDLFTSLESIRIGLQVFILGEYVAIGSAIINYLSGTAFYSYDERFSAGGTNPDDFGFLMALGIPIAMYLASSSNNTKWGKYFSILNYAVIPLMLVGIVLSGTRTALIGSTISLIFVFASLSRIRLWIRIIILLSLTIGSFFVLSKFQTQKTIERLGTTGTELTKGDFNGRIPLWRQGFDSFKQHPLLGVGANMYRTVNKEYKVAHNTFLSVLVETGLIGFILFSIVLITSFSSLLRLPKWDFLFWFTIILVWTIGSSTLTWEVRKTTWLILSFIVAHSALTIREVEKIRFATQYDIEAQTA